MASFLSLFSPSQITLITQRSEITEKQAPSSTGTLVAGDDPGEVYLDDVNALFVTNGVDSGDIVEITAGPIAPLGYYTVASRYFDPKVDASEHEPFEDRIILDGFPTLGGAITYRVLTATDILEALAEITINRSLVDNVSVPEALPLDGIFGLFFDKFNLVCDWVADTYRWLKGLDRSRTGAALPFTYPTSFQPPTTVINISATVATPTVLFPDEYAELAPNRTTIYVGFPPIDSFTIAATDSEQEGKDDEVAAEPASSGGPLLTAYTDALAKQDNALDNQDAALAALEAEIADNDTPGESGDLSAFYTAMSAVIAAQRASIVDRKQDIADIISADDTRPNVGGLNFGTFGALQTEIDARAAELVSAPFQAFLNLRYTYLDLLVNRGFGTRADLYGLLQQVTFDEGRRVTLVADLSTERDLLGLP